MDLYLVLKFVHVVGAMLWVGGASIITLLLIVLDRRRDDAATITAVSYMGLLGNRVFAPLGMLTILLGLVLAWLGGWGFAAWTVLAAITVAGTFALGALFLGPTSERVVRTWEETGDATAAMVEGRRLLRLVKLDLGAQWWIIALMVFKPGWTDPMLLVAAAVLAIGVAAFALDRTGRAEPAAA